MFYSFSYTSNVSVTGISSLLPSVVIMELLPADYVAEKFAGNLSHIHNN